MKDLFYCCIREEQERLNVWVSYLNLEIMYGTPAQLQKVLERAVQQNEPLKVYQQLVNIYVRSGKLEVGWSLIQSIHQHLASTLLACRFFLHMQYSVLNLSELGETCSPFFSWKSEITNNFVLEINQFIFYHNWITGTCTFLICLLKKKINRHNVYIFAGSRTALQQNGEKTQCQQICVAWIWGFLL